MSIHNFDFETEHGLSPIPGADSPPLHTGDPHDDDARIIDALVESQAEPPGPKDLPLVRTPPVDAPEKPATMLVTGSIVFPATAVIWDAFQALPVDPQRRSVRFSVFSATATDYVRMSNDLGKLNADTSAFLMGAGASGSIDMPHTGAVWLKLAAPSVGPVTVSWVAVTGA